MPTRVSHGLRLLLCSVFWGLHKGPHTVGELSPTELHPHSCGLGLWKIVDVRKERERKRVDKCYVLQKVGQGTRDSSFLVPEASHVTSACTSLLSSPWSPHPRMRFWVLLSFMCSSKSCLPTQDGMSGCWYSCGSHLRRWLVKPLVRISETRKPAVALSAPAFLGK